MDSRYRTGREKVAQCAAGTQITGATGIIEDSWKNKSSNTKPNENVNAHKRTTIVKVLNENMRRCLSPSDRRSIGQPTIEESKAIGEARSEKSLQKLIYLELLRRGLFFHYSRSDRKTTTRLGTPDFAFPIKGKYVAIECKTAIGKQTSEQWDTECLIRLQGGLYQIVRTFDEFLDVLKGHGL